LEPLKAEIVLTYVVPRQMTLEVSAMDDRVTILRRQVELYRRYLREGVDVTLATEYLRQITEDEAKLAQIESEGERRR
jgi:hypothetical protein